MKNIKRNITIASVLLLVCAAVYLTGHITTDGVRRIQQWSRPRMRQ